MSSARSAAPTLLLVVLALFVTVQPASADDWLPITPEELKMTSDPNAPGVPAIYLYRQVDRDDQESHEYHYARIKIFTEEGRKYADVEIPSLREKETFAKSRRGPSGPTEASSTLTARFTTRPSSKPAE